MGAIQRHDLSFVYKIVCFKRRLRKKNWSQTDRQTDTKTDCLTHCCACARGVIIMIAHYQQVIITANQQLRKPIDMDFQAARHPYKIYCVCVGREGGKRGKLT